MAFSELQPIGSVATSQLKPNPEGLAPVKSQGDRQSDKSVDKAGTSDSLEISQKSRDQEIKAEKTNIAKRLLRNLPAQKAYVIYSGLAKLKASQYPMDKILMEVTAKLGDDL